jgi:hypothetical protein
MDENKYQRGKIYKIVCNDTNKIYIGSTTEHYLSNRLKRHRLDYRKHLNGKHRYITVYEILQNDNYVIELIELYPCNSKDELFMRERFYFDTIDCINKQKPKITIEEKNERVVQYKLQYKEIASIKKAQRYEQNKETINEKKKEKYTCECGSMVRISDRARHCKSKKHISFHE